MFEDDELAAKIGILVRLLRAEHYELLAGVEQVTQDVLDQVAADQAQQSGLDAELSVDDYDPDFIEHGRSALGRAIALAEAGREVQQALFDCPLASPPSPVTYHWRPPPKRMMVLSCGHGPPEHCWGPNGDGHFVEKDCP